jgi:hypothetical protein
MQSWVSGYPASHSTSADVGLAPYVAALLSCDAFKAAGRGRVDGRAAMELIPIRPAPQSSGSAAIWVGFSASLPLRLTKKPWPGRSLKILPLSAYCA